VVALPSHNRFIHFPLQFGGNSYARRVHRKVVD
jgi:hypothetical protein